MKTSELSGAALDWAVAKCEGVTVLPKMRGGCYVTLDRGETVPLCYSTNWAQGGPIIEREDIAISPLPDGLCRAYAADETMWAPHGVEVFKWKYKQQGYHPLIAAMRCYVAKKLGDEIEIPAVLTQGETR